MDRPLSEQWMQFRMTFTPIPLDLQDYPALLRSERDRLAINIPRNPQEEENFLLRVFDSVRNIINMAELSRDFAHG